MELKKGTEHIVEIIDNGIEGEGIAKIDNFTIFVEQTIKGEKVRILILKVNKHFAYAKPIEIIRKSNQRITEDCSTYKRCGGCSLRFLEYEATLDIKEEIVRNCLKKSNLKDVKVKKTVGMGNPYNYRNKLQYPLGIDKNGNAVMGVYAKRSHEIIAINKCHIQNELSEKIAKDVFDFFKNNNIKIYNEKTLLGTMRHIVIRIGIMTNELMLILVVNNDEFKKEKEFIKYITEKYSQIKTIVKNYNNKNTNVILGNKNEVIYGKGYIYDILGEYKFKISPQSFYQTNITQTEALYNKALEYAKLTGKETILDLYCGIGTIGIFASKKVKKVYGIEIIENAIKDAKENAIINNANNAEFFCGNVEEILPVIIEKNKIKPEVVFIDPPRKGLEKKAIQTLIELKPNKIIYISCNPATFARDVALLQDHYKIKEVTPVDMFPFTSHVECCSVLKLKKSTEM